MMRKNTSPMRSTKTKKMKKNTAKVTMAVARSGKKEVEMDLMASWSLIGRLKKA